MRRIGALFLFAVAAGCASISGFGDLEKVDCVDCAGDAHSDGTTADVAGDSGATDDSGDALAQDGITDAPSVTCPSGKGPAMVAVGSYCVDATEVTATHYAAFLTDKGSDTSGQPAECSWNTSFTPAYWPQTGDNPVVGVDWCDARAFCAWAGKRLCGKIGGGPNAVADLAKSDASQWFHACSRDASRTYPYGSTYSFNACQGGDVKPSRIIAAGTKLGCEGGYIGLFDMSGNAEEWEDSCSGTAGASDTCRVRGGGIYDGSSALACAADRTLARNARNDHSGFRCCAL